MSLSPLLLQELSLLRGLPREELGRLGERMSLRELTRREVVFNKDESGHALFFLLEGRLQAVDFTVDGREVGLYFVDSGDFFGELAVIDTKPQPEFMIAVAKAKIAILPRHEARALMLTTPSVAEQLLARLAARLRQVSAQRTLLALPNPAQRICAQLLQMVEPPIGSGSRANIRQAPTHQEIAIMINTSRETVTRVLQVLQTRGILKRDGNALEVIDPDYLGDVAAGRVEPPKMDKSGG
jgi:CRP-like cAMP-binding protein